jgi:hypothetical protein
MSAFFASVQESAAALLRRCFIASQASASHLLKVALQRLFGADWFEELKKAADETSATPNLFASSATRALLASTLP